MRYLLLVWRREEMWEELSQEETNTLVRVWRRHDEALRESGHVIVMEALTSTCCALTVHTRNGRVVVTDGSHTKTKQQPGGFYLIEARDLNEAIQVAANTAAVRLGAGHGWGVEVRPVVEQTPGTPGGMRA